MAHDLRTLLKKNDFIIALHITCIVVEVEEKGVWVKDPYSRRKKPTWIEREEVLRLNPYITSQMWLDRS